MRWASPAECRAACLAPRSALPGFSGTTSLSATHTAQLPRGRLVGHPRPRYGASRVADAFLVYVLPPVPRCSDWASSSLISPSRVSLPRNCGRVGLHIVLFEACSAFTRVAARTLAPSPICDALHRRLQPFRHLHDCSGCFRLERSPGGALTHWKAPPSHGARKGRPFVDAMASDGRTDTGSTGGSGPALPSSPELRQFRVRSAVYFGARVDRRHRTGT